MGGPAMAEQTDCRHMRVILLGAPGAGKGTQAAYLQGRWGVAHISTGDILRAEVRAESELGRAAQGYMTRGELVPDELIIRMVEMRLKELGEAGYILDGFPRTEAQARALDDLLARLGQRLDAAVNLEVPDAELIRRLSGRQICPQCGAVYHVDTMPPKQAGICDVCGSELAQRADDRPEAIANRLAVYRAQTEPLIAYYRARGKLVTVNGTIGVPRVAEAIREALCEGA